MSDRLIMQLKALQGIGRAFPLPAARVIARCASQIAPGDTGYMAEHIHEEWVEDGSAAVVSEALYSVYVEFGTYKMADQPFMHPAIDEGQNDILRAAAQALMIDIRQALKIRPPRRSLSPC